MPNDSYDAPRGPSIIALIEHEADLAYAEYKNDEPQDDHHGQVQGRAIGLCIALAILRNPYHPDLKTIKKEVAARYAENQAPARR